MGSESSSSPCPIKNVVVLVQENRSFDHMLGWMKSLNQEIDGVTGDESNPISTSDPDSTRVSLKDGSAYVDPDPGHSIQDIYEQVFGVRRASRRARTSPPPCRGSRTLARMSENVINGFAPDAIPVYKELVTEFAVCDQWFASIPSSTQSNRLYLHSATSHGETSNNTNDLVKGFPQKTIFESLEDGGFTFGVYYQIVPTTLF